MPEELSDYIKLHQRFDAVVDRLTEMSKKEEADYLMCYFFIFFNDYVKLNSHIAHAEEMLEKNEW